MAVAIYPKKSWFFLTQMRGGNSRLKHRASPRRCSTTSCPATDFEQECGAPHAALRISRVVSDVVRAYGVAGGRYG
eukprot:scaffold5437_cov70-Phaeocystis_antarctica.AAC.2